MTPRRALAAVALVAVVATRIDPVYFGLLAGTPNLSPIIESHWPSYHAFIDGVRARTSPGDTVALVTPASEPREVYPLAFYRASYLLSGREVLPAIDPRSGEAIPGNVANARYVAVFGNATASGDVVWRGEGGALYRR
jgi:hypothetical protein